MLWIKLVVTNDSVVLCTQIDNFLLFRCEPQKFGPRIVHQQEECQDTQTYCQRTKNYMVPTNGNIDG